MSKDDGGKMEYSDADYAAAEAKYAAAPMDVNPLAKEGEAGAGVTPLIRQAMAYCWSDRFLNTFRAYFRHNAAVFTDFAEGKTEEHDLSFQELFREYLELYENTLEGFLRDMDASAQDLYRDVAAIQGTELAPDIAIFVDCLLASMDYESFLKVMTREARQQARQARTMPAGK